MSYENLFKYSAGNNDGAEQNGDVIINIDTDDVDGNGLPMDTSEVPEGDISVSQEEVAVAEESAAGAEDAGETATDLNELSGELNHFLERGQALTQTDVNYLAKLSYMAQRRNFPGASRSMLVRASLGAGLNDAAGNIEWVVSALNENETGVMANIKAFIKKIVDFFKGIFNAIKTWISGSKKLQGRAEEIIKRAGKTDDHVATASGKYAVVGIGASASKLHTGDSFSLSNLNKGITAYLDLTKRVLTDGDGYAATGTMVNKIISMIQKPPADPNAESSEAEKAVKAAADELAKSIFGSTAVRANLTTMGGLQLGVISNIESYSVKAFAKTTEAKEASELPTLSLSDVSRLAGEASKILDIVVAYQDGWKKRDDTKSALIKGMDELSKKAVTDHKKANSEKSKDDDTKEGVVKGFFTRRKITTACGQTLLSVQMMENKLIGHSIGVANSLLTYCSSSLSNLAAEKKGVEAKAKKNPAKTEETK